MSARKRKREEQNQEQPLRSYTIPKSYQLPAILEIMEAGNINLYCEPNQIRISKDLLVKAAILMVQCKYESKSISKKNDNDNKDNTIEEPYYISVEKSSLLHALKEVNRTVVLFLVLSIFEDHLKIVSYDKDLKEIGKANVQANMSLDEFVLEDPGEEIKYKGKLKIIGKKFVDSIPTTGKQLRLDFESDSNRLVLSTEAAAKDVNSELYIYVPQLLTSKKKTTGPETVEEAKVNEEEDEGEYRDTFGESATKLLKKIIELFKEKLLLLKFDLGYPIHISGQVDTLETIKFYMVGQIPEEEL
jgi:hypothetical protein